MKYKEKVILSQRDLKIISKTNKHLIVKAKFGPSKETKIPLYLDKYLAFFIGVVIGDGHIRKNKMQIAIELTNLNLLKRIIIICKKVFNRSFNLSSKIIRINKKTTQAVYLDSKAIVNLLVEVFEIPRGKKRYIVSVPQQIKNSSQNIKKEFLRGIFLTEGGNRNKGYGLSTASPKLHKGILTLLSELKIPTYSDKWIHKKYKKEYYGLSFKQVYLSKIFGEMPERSNGVGLG